MLVNTHKHYHTETVLMNTDTLFLFSYFLEYVLLFLEDNVDEECECSKVTLQGIP